jgi:hypothetical protein
MPVDRNGLTFPLNPEAQSNNYRCGACGTSVSFLGAECARCNVETQKSKKSDDDEPDDKDDDHDHDDEKSMCKHGVETKCQKCAEAHGDDDGDDDDADDDDEDEDG